MLTRPAIPAADRLALAVCIAIAVHAMLILGVSFKPDTPVPPPPNRLEITLVAARSNTPPPQAEALAQSNSLGGGERAERVRPAAPWLAPQTTEGATRVTPPPPAGAPSPPAVADAKAPKPPVQPTRTAPLAAPPRSAGRMATPAAGAAASEAPTAAPTPTPTYGAANPALPTAAQLITRSFALASMNAELQDRMETRAHRPRQKFISASTQEYRYAAYMEAWRAKVERIGNINYPDEARQHELSGSLLLDVAIRPDGSVIEIVVRKTSGHKVLDDAAVRIVELAAPFAPFPSDIAREVDILHVTRTWRFVNNADFTAQ